MPAIPAADRDKVIIVGAGLAGLTCAKVLAEAGRKFVLLEASAQPGGRAASRRNDDGFILDRGFQVLLDSYPAARRHLDFEALGGGYFRAGAMFVGGGGPRTLANPLHHPSDLFSSLGCRDIGLGDKLRFARLASGALLIGEALLRRRAASASDETAAQLLRRRGFGKKFFVNFAQPFFGGVLLDPDLQASASLLLSYVRRFATGRALLPGEGIGAIGQQLASRLPSDSARFGAAVDKLLPGQGVALRDGAMVSGSDVVLAVAEPELCRLLGKGEPRAARSTAVHYFAAQRKWYDAAWLCLPPRRAESPVLHAALVTNAAPTLAPDGQHLWSVTVVAGHPAASDARAVAAEIAAWFGADPRDLRHLEFVEVPYAVPRQPPGFAGRPAPWGDLPPRVHVAGDAASAASIDAAMASGEAVAKNLIASARAC